MKKSIVPENLIEIYGNEEEADRAIEFFTRTVAGARFIKLLRDHAREMSDIRNRIREIPDSEERRKVIDARILAVQMLESVVVVAQNTRVEVEIDEESERGGE